MPALDAFSISLKPREFEKIRRLAYDTFGLDLRTGKETLVSARLGKQIRQFGFASFDEYYQHVVADKTGESLIHLIDALATNHTSFFREPVHFDFLRKILRQWKQQAVIAIWSAACSTGEEPYSIAMCVLDEFGESGRDRVRILATDISTRVLSKAAEGIYPEKSLEGLPGPLLRKYWLRGEGDWRGSYRAKKSLRDMIEFRRLNLMEPVPSMNRFALIFCRNVMIYFDKPTQQGVVERLAACLEPGGYLLTGHAETLAGVTHGLRYVEPAVYCKPPLHGLENRKW